MLGFRISVNGTVVCTASSDTVASVIATLKGSRAVCGEEAPRLNVNGITAPYTHTTWHRSEVELGDTITIEVVDVAKSAISEPIEVRKTKP